MGDSFRMSMHLNFSKMHINNKSRVVLQIRFFVFLMSYILGLSQVHSKSQLLSEAKSEGTEPDYFNQKIHVSLYGLIRTTEFITENMLLGKNFMKS